MRDALASKTGTLAALLGRPGRSARGLQDCAGLLRWATQRQSLWTLRQAAIADLAGLGLARNQRPFALHGMRDGWLRRYADGLGRSHQSQQRRGLSRSTSQF